MSRYKSKLSPEQKKEIAILVNAGIPFSILAKDYSVSLPTIHAISRLKRQWIENEKITTHNKECRFRYAQEIYPQLDPYCQKYIFDIYYEPIIKSIQGLFAGESPEKRLLKAILGPECLPNIDEITLAEHRARIKEQALFLIPDVERRVIYPDRKQAVLGIGSLIAKYQEDNLTVEQKKIRVLLRRKINNLLRTLKPRKRKILKVRYGFYHNYLFTLKKIGQRFGLTRERVRQIEIEAITILQHPRTAEALRQLLYAPDFRKCLQRFIFLPLWGKRSNKFMGRQIKVAE